MKHPAQRVGVFIDVSNMYHSAKSSYGANVNFGKVVEAAVAGRQLVRAIAYCVKADVGEEQSFFDALEKRGIEVYTKELQTFGGGVKKGNVDMELAIDALKLAPKLDVVVIVSGDGDYTILLQHLKAQGCRVEVMGFGKSLSGRLVEEADDVIDMSLNVKDFLIGFSRRPRSSKPSGPVPQAPSTAPVTSH